MSTTRILQFLKLAAVASVNIGVISTAVRQSIKNNPPFVSPSERMSTSYDEDLSTPNHSPNSIRNKY